MIRIFSFLVIIVCLGCSKTPEPINYGTDMCHFCKMTIVTKTHAAQMVTNKGKQYKFDAIECMIWFLEDKNELEEKSNLLIANYNKPGVMIPAKTAGFLICDEITSPMGANLSGFVSIDSAKQAVHSKTAKYFGWDKIRKRLK